MGLRLSRMRVLVSRGTLDPKEDAGGCAMKEWLQSQGGDGELWVAVWVVAVVASSLLVAMYENHIRHLRRSMEEVTT